MRQNNNPDKRTLRKDWRLLWRAAKIWQQIAPHFWAYSILTMLVSTLSPYFSLYMSAQLVNELAGSCDFYRLLLLGGITVGGQLILSIISRILDGRKNIAESYSIYKHEEYMTQAQNGFQYEHLENPDVVLQRSRIEKDMLAFGGGLMKVLWTLPRVPERIIDIILSVSLTVSLFAMTAKGEFSGLFKLINSPVSALPIVALIVVNTVFSVKISTTRTNKEQEAISELAEENVRYFTYTSLWGADMTVFDLHRIVMEEYRKHHLRPKWVEKSSRVSVKYGSYMIILDTVLDAALFAFVAAKAYIGAFGIGNFILYKGTISRFIGAVSGLGTQIGELRYNNKFLIQLYEYLDMPNDMYKGTLAVEKRDDLDYEIEFRDVSFKYPRTDNYALRHINMKFKIGDKLAIVGENGSGKTTFIKLLCRLYDPTEGKILLNGIDITRYRYNEYMALFSVVFQDYTLFDFSIGDNVAASTQYDEAKVRDCLIRARMGEKLSSLDTDAKAKGNNALDFSIGRGYDSEGIDISGGERQKIALARALYKDAPFVILDEPTAALDPIAEAAVYEDFNKITEDKTAVFISHRLSSCRFCDTIAVFDKGQLVQEGSHDTLVAVNDGKYAELWRAQAQYYKM